MKNEWYCVLGVTLVAAIIFIINSPTFSAGAGWFVLLTGFVWAVTALIWSGREVKQAPYKDIKYRLADHRTYVAILTTFLLVGIAGIEIAVRKSGGLWGDPLLVSVHLFLVACMTTTFLLARFKMTGKRSPTRHRLLVYSFMVFYLGSLITGTELVFDKFDLREPQSMSFLKEDKR